MVRSSCSVSLLRWRLRVGLLHGSSLGLADLLQIAELTAVSPMRFSWETRTDAEAVTGDLVA